MTTTISLLGSVTMTISDGGNYLGQEIAETLKHIIENGNPNELLEVLKKEEEKLGVFFR